ncbi:leucine-rich repeat domain-containing protein, partial [bacterium]|nr:leucine-rich repeat domain-containing protein [bacterium]
MKTNTLHQYLKVVSISEGVQKISSNAFKSCSKITTLTLPNMLTEIGDNAFEGTGITSITIPSNCYSIGQGV